MRVTFTGNITEDYEDEPWQTGAEGTIHRSRDGQHVVKFYLPGAGQMPDSERIKRIDLLINELNPTKNEPFWEQYYTWPQLRATAPQTGFRMRFAAGLQKISRYMEVFTRSYSKVPYNERGWFIGRLAVAIKLAAAADRMARMGLCYPDFSHNNILIEPFEGRMALIDCDSLTVPSRLPPTVEGTSFYRAPELVSAQLHIPNVNSDLHALAVMLYIFLLGWHPLLGDRNGLSPDASEDEKLQLGVRALYVEHPTDRSNYAKMQKYRSPILGPKIEKLFRKSFVEALQKPDDRPRPLEWLDALNEAFDHVIPCASHSCDWRFFIAQPAPGLRCPRCGEPVRAVSRLPVLYLQRHKGRGDDDDYDLDIYRARRFVIGWPGRTLHRWHAEAAVSENYVDRDHPPDRQPRADFLYDHNQWLLRNIALDQARYLPPSETVWQPWARNQAVPLASGMKLQMGAAPAHYRILVQMVEVQ